jgi:hypothetical protein
LLLLLGLLLLAGVEVVVVLLLRGAGMSVAMGVGGGLLVADDDPLVPPLLDGHTFVLHDEISEYVVVDAGLVDGSSLFEVEGVPDELLVG